MALSITNLSKTYPNGTQALKNVSLEIPTGMFGLLGPNGAGKSSLMRTIATLQDADTGSIMLDDIDVLRDKEAVRRVLGYLPQETPFKLYVFYYLYLLALDAGHIAQAAHYLREHRARLTGVPDALQAAAWLESAFFAAAYEHDLPAARAFQGQAKPSAHTPTDVPARVEAALARLTGDTDRARAQAQTSLQALPKNLDQGSALFYAEWLADTLRWANEPLPLLR